jgi:hypothetical protein
LVEVIGAGTQQVTITFRPPTLNLTVTPSTVAVGDTAELDWSGTNLANCTASGAWTGPEPTSGPLAVTPTRIGSSTYTLTCTGLDGSTVTSSAVLKAIPRPTVSLTANGKAVAVVTGSGEVTLAWSSTYATACTASGAWSGAEPTSGSLSFAATAKSFQTYTLSCLGRDGVTAKHSAYVWAR